LAAVSIENAALGIVLIVAGVAAAAWSIVAETYDDRLEDRSLDRVRRFGWRYDPLPVTRVRRAAGVTLGIAMLVAGAWWLVSGYSA
jgi:4-hydroxybenzoate polyprenyltransferase